MANADSHTTVILYPFSTVLLFMLETTDTETASMNHDEKRALPIVLLWGVASNAILIPIPHFDHYVDLYNTGPLSDSLKLLPIARSVSIVVTSVAS